MKCSLSPQSGLLYLLCADIDLSSLKFLPPISKLLYEEKNVQNCIIRIFNKFLISLDQVILSQVSKTKQRGKKLNYQAPIYELGGPLPYGHKLLKAEVQKIVFDPTSKFEPDPLPFILTCSLFYTEKWKRSTNYKLNIKHTKTERAESRLKHELICNSCSILFPPPQNHWTKWNNKVVASTCHCHHTFKALCHSGHQR